MGKEFGSESMNAVAAAAQNQQIQVQIDDAQATTMYASTVQVGGGAEEISLGFSAGLRGTGPNTAVLKIEQRVVMSPWAAKRLAILLGQAIQRYEETYGALELDERKRRVGGPSVQPVGKPS